jgi:hypothetical protein
MIRKLDLRIVLGVVSLLIGLLLLAIFGQQYQLTCSRMESSITDSCTNARGWVLSP